MAHSDTQATQCLSLSGDTYLQLTVSCLWDNAPLVLGAGFVCTLMCTPVLLLFTAGLLVPALILCPLMCAPIWIALLALEGQIVCGVKMETRAVFTALPHYWRRSTGLGLCCCSPLFAALLTLPALSRPPVAPVVWVGLAADLFALCLSAALSLYAFPLTALYDLSLGEALRNALLLASRHIVNTFGLVSMAVLFAFAVGYVSSGLLFFLPAVWGLFIINNCRMVVGQELGEG